MATMTIDENTTDDARRQQGPTAIVRMSDIHPDGHRPDRLTA